MRECPLGGNVTQPKPEFIEEAPQRRAKNKEEFGASLYE